MSEALHEVVESLPQSSLTTHLLGALDYLVPGEWTNITTFEGMVRDATGESDEGIIQQVGERAIALFADENNGYQRAVSVFRGVDSASTVAGAAAMANLLGQQFDVLSFMTDVTPKPDTTQAIDAALKLGAELTAFTLVNGLPGDSVGDFVSSLANYGKEEKMRFAAWLAFDCIVPLGPDFLNLILGAIESVSLDELADNRVFRFVSDHLPGDIAQKRDTLRSNVDQTRGHIEGFVGERGMSQESLLARVREYVQIADDKLDVLAAALDLSTNTFEHTGIQTVARRVITRAYGEI